MDHYHRAEEALNLCAAGVKGHGPEETNHSVIKGQSTPVSPSEFIHFYKLNSVVCVCEHESRFIARIWIEARIFYFFSFIKLFFYPCMNSKSDTNFSSFIMANDSKLQLNFNVRE